jgi:hypothetical protein
MGIESNPEAVESNCVLSRSAAVMHLRAVSMGDGEDHLALGYSFGGKRGGL